MALELTLAVFRSGLRKKVAMELLETESELGIVADSYRELHQ